MNTEHWWDGDDGKTEVLVGKCPIAAVSTTSHMGWPETELNLALRGQVINYISQGMACHYYFTFHMYADR
jgi:hypothetical protein